MAPKRSILRRDMRIEREYPPLLLRGSTCPQEPATEAPRLEDVGRRRPVKCFGSWWPRYAVALAAPLVAWGLRELFTPLVGPTAVMLIFFYPAVALASWYGRIRAGIAAIICSILLATYVLLEPLRAVVPGQGWLLLLVIFAAVCLMIAGTIEAMHRARESAVRNAQQLRTVLESIGECFYVLDDQGRFTYVNAHMARHVGRPAAALLGRVAWELFPQVLGTELERQLRRAMAEAVPAQFEVLSPITNRWLEIRAYPSRCELSVFFRDVTERKEAEHQLRAAKEELARANSELERKVADRTAKLTQTVTDLEQFSYSISHDLRAPLRSMQAFSSLLLEEHRHHLADSALDYLKRIEASAKRMLRLLDAVLHYSEVARREMPLGPVNLDQLVRDLIEQYPNLHPDSVDLEVMSPLCPVKGSVPHLTQCLSNLLGNAVKFVAPGVRPKVRVWTEERDGGCARICVQDNGIGIESRLHGRLWRIFERGVPDHQYEGTGIGLSVVKRAVERMGGTVGMESEPGKGSTFWFELPKADANVRFAELRIGR